MGERLVFRIQRGDRRGATWLDRQSRVLWILAVGPRREGSDDDLYERVKSLNEGTDRLFPTSDDYLRDRLESATRWLKRARGQVVALVESTRHSPGVEVRGLLCDRIRVCVRLDVVGGVQEWLVAVRTSDKELGPVTEREREMIFALFEEATEAEVWEYQISWPGRELDAFEVVKLGLRE